MNLEDGATQEGANQNEDQPRELTARERAMEAISASRRAVIEDESGVKMDADADPDEAAAEAERQRLAQMEDEPAKKDEEDFMQRRVTIKVDGEEREMTFEQMQREVQKHAAADKRLAEATQMRREAEQLQAQLQQSVPVSNTSGQQDVEVDPAAAKAFTEALFAGESDEAVAAFNKAVSKAVQAASTGRQETTQQVDPEAVVRSVEQRLAVKSALKQSRSDYPELYADPDIEQLGAVKIQRRQQDGMSFVDALAETQTELAQKFGWGKAAGRQQSDDANARNAKLEAKQRLDNPSSASVKASVVETPPATNSDVIAEMAARRGQTVLR